MSDYDAIGAATWLGIGNGIFASLKVGQRFKFNGSDVVYRKTGKRSYTDGKRSYKTGRQAAVWYEREERS